MLLERNVVGKKEDWANYITLADEHETPMLRRLPKGSKPVAVVKHYQADSYDTPTSNPWPDGKDWDTFKTAGANRVELTARCQWFVQTAAVSKLAEDVTDTAGIQSELAHEIPKAMTQMAREMECSAAGPQAAYADDAQTGHKFRGAGKWIQATAQSDADDDVGAAVRPPSASCIAPAYGSGLTENALKAVFESMWNSTGNTGTKVGFVGSKLKKIFGDFQFYLPSSMSTQSTSRIATRPESNKSIGVIVDRYESDWGPVELHMTRWIHHENFGGNATYAPYCGYFMNPDRWQWCWNQKPTVYKPEFKGGSYKAAIDAILMFLCLNPVGEGKTISAS